MKPITLSFLAFALLLAVATNAQQYKLRQLTTTSGMKMESTVYVKKSRKRTESSGYNGMATPVSIEQCDLQRTIYINDKKKLFYIDKWQQQENNEPQTAQHKPSHEPKKEIQPTPSINGGIVHNWYSVVDTGERKKMFGFIARHVWTNQRIIPGANACMKDSMKMKSDGWYIDLPQFSCTTNSGGAGGYGGGGGQQECRDQFITHQSGKGKLGFALEEVKTFVMGNGQEFVSRIETLELSTARLDSMLFEIPEGYTQASGMSDLQDMNFLQAVKPGRQREDNAAATVLPVTEEKPAGTTRIGVFAPHSEEQLNQSELQTALVKALFDDDLDAVAINSPADAVRYHCDYVLNIDFTRIRQGSKMGGILKAIKNADPGSATNYNIDLGWTLNNVNGGAKKASSEISGKFEGKIDAAAARALEKAAEKIKKAI